MRYALNTLLGFVIVLLLYSNWRTAQQLKAEHQERVQAIGRVESAWMACEPAVYLHGSSNPIDAISMLRYRDNQNGRACVFMEDGRYGNLWWSVIVEGKSKGHLEWQFQEMGHYKF